MRYERECVSPMMMRIGKEHAREATSIGVPRRVCARRARDSRELALRISELGIATVSLKLFQLADICQSDVNQGDAWATTGAVSATLISNTQPGDIALPSGALTLAGRS